ncbi:MAG TPA: hypothetical protein VGW10_10460, partial [Solirubrobacteraceae bacterium]|nr:hypothetical protein [Solirubrobacteraceae bacterium]
MTARRVAVVDGRRLSVLLARGPAEDPLSELVLRRRGSAEELRFAVAEDEAIVDAESVPEGVWETEVASERASAVVVLDGRRVRARAEAGRLVVECAPLAPWTEVRRARVE